KQMPLKSKQCTEAIAEFIGNNASTIPRNQVYLRDYPHLNDGTKPSCWKRAGKKKVGDRILRIYRHEDTNIDFHQNVVLWEQNDTVVEILLVNWRDLLENYVKTYNISYDNGINTTHASQLS